MSPPKMRRANMIELTAAQKKAVTARGKNLCVSAGAGTGKTGVLVERFLFLVSERHARTGEILAITFTEKAAQEMKKRVAAAFQARGLDEPRRELENAYIGTIHSFCARILREHPIEAGLDPDFRVLEEEESDILKEQVLDQLIEERFGEPAVLDLLRAYSEEGVRRAVTSVASRAHALGMEISKIASATPESLPRNDVPKETTKNAVIASRFEDTAKQSYSKAMEILASLKTIKNKAEDCAALEEALAKPLSNWEAIESLRETSGKFKRQGNAKEQISVLQDCLNEWIGHHVELLAQPPREAFLALARDFESRFRAAKRERSSLDFNDLEREAVRLIGGTEPRSEACRVLYRSKFKFIMVDEFQDTAPLQDRLMTLIARPDNQFIVGDWKQSIYGFRGTDVSLFSGKERLFAETGERIPLVENFRSRQEVLDFINPFFEQLWAGEGKTFEPLAAARTVILRPTLKGCFAEAEESLNKDPSLPSTTTASLPSVVQDDSHSTVEFLVVERGPEESVEEGRANEARVLAERIDELVRSGAYEHRDFAMLFRAGTDLYFYEYELRNRRIPYYVVSGRGFYHLPEVRDLTAFLEILENPHLDIPLASVLRSPLVQISDDALFWLANWPARAGGKLPLYAAVLRSGDITEISGTDQERLESFRGLLAGLLREKEKWAVSELLELIVERTRYNRYVLGLPQGRRHLANIRKLLEIAREVESREPAHLGDFVRYVKGLETEEVRESEAQVEAEEGAVVKLMTIHKAKGLEFKVVVIPDLNRRHNQGGAPFLIDPEHGFGAKVLNDVACELEETPTWRRIRDKINKREREESKRLLYVAMTRAKDHLILSGASKKNAKKTENEDETDLDERANWFEWINRWTASAGGALTRTVIAALKRGDRRPGVPLAGRKKINEALEQGGPLPVEPPEIASEILERLQPIQPVYFDRIDLPVSALALFAHDREEYRRVYELGILPEECHPEPQAKDLANRDSSQPEAAQNDKTEEWSIDEPEESINAAEFGTVTHKIFEYLVSAPGQAGGKLPFLLKNFAGNLEEQVREELKSLGLQFLRSKQFTEIREARVRYPEVPFTFKLEKGIVQGTLDLLYQTAAGEWVILDYKTSRVEAGQLKETAARYRAQMMLYALACEELLKIRVTKARLYFVRTDQPFDFSMEQTNLVDRRSEFERLQKEIVMKRKEWVS